MNAVSDVVLGGVGFHEIGGLSAANGTVVSTTIWTFPNNYLFPYIDCWNSTSQAHLAAKVDQLYKDNGLNKVQLSLQSLDANPFDNMW